jgi:hypothetical protein
MRAIWTRLAPGIAALALTLASGAANAACDFLTGGGFIIINTITYTAKANFGVGGGCSKDGTPTWGHLEYIDHGYVVDHGPGLNVHGTSITAYFPDISDPNKARFICGKARTNLPAPNDDNVDFAVRARDTGEPGVMDEFDIVVRGTAFVYSTFIPGFPHKLNDGNGGGGNIQLHGPREGNFGGLCPALGAA